MKPYSIQLFLKLLKQNRIRKPIGCNYYIDIIEHPFYDENRATPEVLNTLYEISHPQKKEIPYEKGKHSYYQCVYDGEKTYLEIKYRHLPYAKTIITYLSKIPIAHRKIDSCLNILDLNLDPLFMQSLIGIDISDEIYKIVKYYEIVKEVK